MDGYTLVGLIIIASIVFFIVRATRKEKYLRDHKAIVIDRNSFFDKGRQFDEWGPEKWTTGYSDIWSDVITYDHMNDSLPTEKREFLTQSQNDRARICYLHCMTRAVAWKLGWIPEELKKADLSDPFRAYYDHFGNSERRYYEAHPNSKITKEEALEIENKQYKKYWKTYNRESFWKLPGIKDVREVWEMDKRRFSY